MEEHEELTLTLGAAAYASATADEVVRMVAEGESDARQRMFALAVLLDEFRVALEGLDGSPRAEDVLAIIGGVGATMGGWMRGEVGDADLPAAMAPWQDASEEAIDGLVDELTRLGADRAEVEAYVAEVMGVAAE